jgi:PAS domain S-box-containing protein
MNRKPNLSDDLAELRHRAEFRLRGQRKRQRSKAGAQPRKGPGARSKADTARMLHELEVHQIELDDMEVVLERYTDLYDFAPVGYASIDAEGLILEVNLTGAVLLGVERSRLIRLRLERFVAPESRAIFKAFLEKVFTVPRDHYCEALLLKGGGAFWAGIRGTSAVLLKGTRKWCRVAFGDITDRKQAEKAQHRLEALADTNRGLNREIARRQTVEKALQKSQQHQSRLLEQSHHMQEQLRHLSHQILHAQEEERKRISRELHDEIAQTLVGINVHLAALTREVADNPRGFRQKIARTQRLMEKSVDIVHRFARELRPAALDDLGLIPALHAFMKEFTKRTGIHIHFTTFTSDRIKQLNNATRTMFYRVAQEALTNVARHAQASLVEVSFEKLPNAICLKIKDNGKSFQAQRVMHSKQNTRLGLIGMRERLEMVGGSFGIESAPGKGTTVRAQIPLANCRGEDEILPAGSAQTQP